MKILDKINTTWTFSLEKQKEKQRLNNVKLISKNRKKLIQANNREVLLRLYFADFQSGSTRINSHDCGIVHLTKKKHSKKMASTTYVGFFRCIFFFK